MKTLYLNCSMGAAGDMLMAALLELLPDPDSFVSKLNALAIPEVHFEKEKSIKCGITGTHMKVTVHGQEEGEMHHHHHHHSHLQDIEHIVSHLDVSDGIWKDILAVYQELAQAESKVHGVPVTDIHFHEVGTMDAIADVTAVCMLMAEIAPDQVIVSPVHVGSGQVHCAHGILSVPAPATAYILKGIPIYGGQIDGELCTPTGAALLKYFATKFGDMPIMNVTSIGYGMGTKDFEAANCVRAFLGETEDQTEQIYELHCNVDDMTGEEIGFATEALFEAGAVEVFTIPVQMKKNRPGTLFCVLCTQEKHDVVVRTLFQYTTTIGIREKKCDRYVLDRTIESINTAYGQVHYKHSSGYGIQRDKYEYEDLVHIARKQGWSLMEVIQKINTEK